MQASLRRRKVKSWALADEGIMEYSCKLKHHMYESLGMAALLRAKVQAASTSGETPRRGDTCSMHAGACELSQRAILHRC